MLSRVAENIYWMNRYLERAENYARFIDVNFNLALELHPDVSTQWKPLVVATGDWPSFEAAYGEVDKVNVIKFLGFDETNQNSIYNSILSARENARAIRSEITKEVWEQINMLYYYVKDAHAKERWTQHDPRDYFVEIKKGCQLIWGLYESTISQSDGWHFSRIGRSLERADKTSRILDIKYLMLLPKKVKVGSTFDLVQWSALLKSVSAYDMYRKQYGKLTSMDIIEYLIFDKKFPRSIFSCLLRVENSLRAISRGDDTLNQAQRQLGQIKSRLEYSDVNDIVRAGMHEYLDELQTNLNALSTTLFETYFSVDNQIGSLAQTQGSFTQTQGGLTQTQTQNGFAPNPD